ncbi:MAG: Mfa1 fimbrilin C-terminal domain-containing protein [Alistipes sp.]|nr:Mfa1 fimbrilin C-terminal domain-containing protein [Alistipes sp.]
MKKYLFIALAALGFAACAEKAETNVPVNNGEKEQSYVAVTFTADGVTRAEDYAVGTDAERAVKSAYVFFFQNGKAFTVNGKASHPGDVNWVNVMDQMDGQPNDADGDAMDNVSDIKDTVLVLENYKGEYPTHVVAVLNWTPENKAYSLDELKAVISELGNDTNGYVMSNSVYLNSNVKTVDAVALTEANIAKKAEDAKANPITIHVERIAAKVEFPEATNGKLFDIERTVEDTVDDQPNGSANETKVFAKIVGFELYNDYEKSWLIKKVDESWGLTDRVLGLNWNESGRYRSFWANSLSPVDGEDFPANTFAWGSDNTAVGGYNYIGENTRDWTTDDVRTKVIVKAQLVKEDGVTPVEVVSWWGKEYVGEDHLKIVVANTLNNTYFKLVDSKYVGIQPEDLECIVRNSSEENAYEVYFGIAQSKKGEKWHKYMDSKYDEIALDKLNEELKEVEPALVYKNGMTYYYTDIKHLGYPKSTSEYGIVRNHIYRVNITDINGYGTPVYNENLIFETPDKPEDITTFVAAQINILSWRVVDHNYEL